ncbi:transmembrane protein 64-like [Hydra vulgaris]|uniref:Transmembrane protein 64-like n=1 Tax=Hydra vulgaris TaxID=6087 RepID=A0ABM4DQ68_HYDVU
MDGVGVEDKVSDRLLPQVSIFSNKKDHTSIDFLEINDSGQKCFGERSDVERVLDTRCNCLRSKCLHLSGTFILLCISGIVLVFFFRRYINELLEWLQHLDGRVSGLLFVLMFTIVSFPMTWGYILLNVAAGYLYGFFIGLATVTVSVLIGVTTSLIICRLFIRGFLKSKLESEHLKAIIRVVESRRGFKVVFLTRLTPIPFGLQNGLFAITNMDLSKCLLASFAGLLPTQALNAYMGSSLRTIEDVVHHNSPGGYFMFAIQVGISGFLMWYVIRRARYELNKACLASDYEKALDDLSVPNKGLLKVTSNVFESKKPFAENFVNGDKVSKKGHKRAQSASAVLYALDNDTF